jgi:hypothetical protein
MVSLYIIAMRGLDVIVGMDWLARHGAEPDCEGKSINLRSPEGTWITFNSKRTKPQPNKEILTALDTKRAEVVLVVQAFFNVFLEELPGMPLDREIEFTIDLVLGTTPIFKESNRMSTEELKELVKKATK